ncbi:hypothetical protein REPUB_Repub18cG0043700 [Reevesia pubescens]
MDKSWMQKSRSSQEYHKGVEEFLNFALEKASEDGMILCPYMRSNSRGHPSFSLHNQHDIIREDDMGSIPPSFSTRSAHSPIRQDDMEGMLRYAFNMHNQNFHNLSPQNDEFNDSNVEMNDFSPFERVVGEQQSSAEASKFYKLLDDMNEELYEGSSTSKLSFSMRLFHLKCLCGLMGNSLTLLLEFMKDMFPFAKIPDSCKDMKKMIKDLGFGYEKIHSCPKDCMLYWGDRANQQSCHVCGNSRW